MHASPMEVFLIGKPSINWDQVAAWLKRLDGREWLDRIDSERDENASNAPDATEPELLAEMAGRRCYQSWRPGLNANVSRVREDSVDYLRNIVKVGHGSVLEHAQFTFALEGISRVVTHELVRHRVGVAISQESLRYVRLTELPFNLPQFILDDPELENEAIDLLQRMESFQETMAERTDIDNMASFHDKKQITSAMRRFAPIGLSTGMIWSANIRTLRQTIEARTADGAEEEIRRLFHMIGEIMVDEAPALFADFFVNDKGEWIPGRSKV